MERVSHTVNHLRAQTRDGLKLTGSSTVRTSSQYEHEPGSRLHTHDVTNQPPLFENFNSYLGNRRLVECVAAFRHPESADISARAEAFGAACGRAENLEHARLANENPPQFAPFDRHGRRIDNVRYHPSYHRMHELARKYCVPSLAWTEPRSHLSRAVLSSMQYQLESGAACPLTMTYAVVPALKKWNDRGQFDEWIEKLTVSHYDGRDCHISQKTSATCGMSMTEKQGGSDIRANSTYAVCVSEKERVYHITGHKWFTSAPMSDGFLVLANVEGKGPTCFLVPRWTSPGQRNSGMRFMRLKSKVGDRSNASAEVEYFEAVGTLVGKEGRGVATIIDMVTHTRLDCLYVSAALMQIAVAHACHNAAHRTAFGSTLAEKPLMRAVMCDLALEVEGATALGMRVAAAFDRDEDKHEVSFRRIAVAIGKYYVCKRATAVIYEALEALGGNGYVEESPVARFYRQAPLNAIWEGSGNVIVLDVFRALAKDRGALSVLGRETESANDTLLSQSFARCQQAISLASKDNTAEIRGRQIVEHLALLLEAVALKKSGGPPTIYEAFVLSRLGSHDADGFPVRSPNFGALPPKAVIPELMERFLPVFL